MLKGRTGSAADISICAIQVAFGSGPTGGGGSAGGSPAGGGGASGSGGPVAADRPCISTHALCFACSRCVQNVQAFMATWRPFIQCLLRKIGPTI